MSRIMEEFGLCKNDYIWLPTKSTFLTLPVPASFHDSVRKPAWLTKKFPWSYSSIFLLKIWRLHVLFEKRNLHFEKIRWIHMILKSFHYRCLAGSCCEMRPVNRKRTVKQHASWAHGTPCREHKEILSWLYDSVFYTKSESFIFCLRNEDFIFEKKMESYDHGIFIWEFRFE